VTSFQCYDIKDETFIVTSANAASTATATSVGDVACRHVYPLRNRPEVKSNYNNPQQRIYIFFKNLNYIWQKLSSTTMSDKRKKKRKTISDKRKCKRKAMNRQRRTIKNVATPMRFGQKLLDYGLHKEDHFGYVDGQWVQYDTVSNIIHQILQTKLTYQGKPYDLLVCMIDSKGDVLMNNQLITDVTKVTFVINVYVDEHYALSIIDPFEKTIHMFDTCFHRTDSYLRQIIREVMPNAADKLAELKTMNHSGVLRQTGATCGPWVVWLCFAYAFNYRQCRSDSETLQYDVLQVNPIDFWKVITE
jgi:hypothetical protein